MNSPVNVNFSMNDFLEHGHSDPITLISPEAMAKIRPAIEALLCREPAGDFYSRDPGAHGRLIRNRHLDCPELLALATHASLLKCVTAILGQDLLIWRVQLFNKEPGGREIPWHQDAGFWPLNPTIAVSAWIAIDETTVDNSCVQVISGSHRSHKPHVQSTREMALLRMVETSHIDFSRKVDMELRPGQCFLFTERVLHHSEPNRSTKRRMGVSVRFIPTSVQVRRYDGADHGTVLVHGKDQHLLNRMAIPKR